MSAEKVHAVIIVDSAKRHISQSMSRSDFIYRMRHPVNFYNRSRDKQYFARIENVNLPISFYAINGNFNTFIVTETDASPATLVVTVAQGNYTIDELIAELKVQLDANTTGGNVYTITYDEITQKVTISYATSGGTTAVTIDATSGSSTNNLGPILGFTENFATSFAPAATLTGNDVAYTNTTRYIKLFVDNMNSSNVYDNENVQKVALKLPINEVRNEFQFYGNNHGYKIQLPSIPTINELRIKLTDPNNNVIDLNGVDWSFDVVFYEWTRPGAELAKHIRSIGGSSLSRGAAASGH